MFFHQSSYSPGSYFYLLISFLGAQHVQGFLCKPWSLSLFLRASQLHLALFLLVHNSFFLASYLVDLFAVDFPSNKKHRFLLYYSLWLPFSVFRLSLVLAVSPSLMVLSIGTLFPSAV